MVRVNLVEPWQLSDQHLVAEYLEIKMLMSYVLRNKSQSGIPLNYQVGKGHQKFFKNKARFLMIRHNLVRNEMAKRNIKTKIAFFVTGTGNFQAEGFSIQNGVTEYILNWWKCGYYTPSYDEIMLSRLRIAERIKNPKKAQHGFHRYYHKIQEKQFFKDLLFKFKNAQEAITCSALELSQETN